MFSAIWSHTKPHLFAVIGFVFIVVIAFSPIFFKGLSLSQHDIQQGVGTTHQLREFEKETGEPALWMYTTFGGMPAYLNSLQFAGNFTDEIQAVLNLGLPRPPQIIFVTCLSFYIMLLAFGVRPWIAFIASAAFGLNGFNIIGIVAGHNAKIQAVAYIPLVIAGVKLAFSKKYLLGSVLFALALALQINANHLQMTYYLLLIIMVFGLVELVKAIKEKDLPNFLKSTMVLVAGAVIAIGVNFGSLWTVIEYSKYSTRGKRELTQNNENETGLDKDYAFQYSNGIYEPLVMFLPNVLGGSTQEKLDRESSVGEALKQAGYAGQQLDQQLAAIPTYWGDQPATAPYYIGSSILLLLVLGFLYMTRAEKQWLIVVLALGVLLSYGSNFSSLNNFLFDFLPGYNKFRSVTFTIIMAMFAIVLASGLGLDRLLKDESKAKTKNLLIALSVSVGFGFLMILTSFMLRYHGAIDERIGADWFVSALREDRASMFRIDAWRIVLYSIFIGGAIWAWINQKVSKVVLVAAVSLLILLDILSLTKRFLDQDTFGRRSGFDKIVATEADKYINQLSKPGERVLNLQNPFNEARTSYFHESIGGYHGAKMRRYMDLIEYRLGNEISTAIQSLQSGSRNFSSLTSLNMLNTRFFMAGSEKNAVILNNYALGQAWVVNEVKEVTTADDEMEALDQTDVQTTAIINTSQFDVTSGFTGTGTIELVSKTPNELLYNVQVDGGKALGVFSEVYYPEGWIAEVDGNEVPILRTDYILRALELKEGNYQVKFTFHPNSYYVGSAITWIFNILLILLVLGTFGWEIKKSLAK